PDVLVLPIVQQQPRREVVDVVGGAATGGEAGAGARAVVGEVGGCPPHGGAGQPVRPVIGEAVGAPRDHLAGIVYRVAAHRDRRPEGVVGRRHQRRGGRGGDRGGVGWRRGRRRVVVENPRGSRPVTALPRPPAEAAPVSVTSG